MCGFTGQLGEFDGKRFGRAVANQRQRRIGAGRAFGNSQLQTVPVINFLAVEFGYKIAKLDPGLFCGRVGHDIVHQNALLAGQIKKWGDAGVNILHMNAQIAARDPAAADEAFHDVAGEIDGHGETDAFISHGIAFDHRVDADEPALGIHQRAAGISRIDRRVGLDEILNMHPAVIVEIANIAAERADDAHRHALADIEGVSNREHNVADFKLIAVAKRDGGQAGGVNFQHGHVRQRIGANHPGGIFFFVVRKGDLDFIHAFHNVVGGQDITIRRYDDPGAEALFLARDFPLAATVLSVGIAKKLAEERIVEHGIPIQALMDDVRGKNVDDARRGFFDNRRIAGDGLGVADNGCFVHGDGQGRVHGPGGEIKQANHSRRAHQRGENPNHWFWQTFHRQTCIVHC